MSSLKREAYSAAVMLILSQPDTVSRDTEIAIAFFVDYWHRHEG